MPEFILDTATPRLQLVTKAGILPPFASLSEFVQGFIEAMFFTDGDTMLETGPSPLVRHVDALGYQDLDPEFLATIQRQCDLFEARHALLLLGAYDAPRRDPYGPTEAGRDFWYTINGHGTGFWDRELGMIGEALSDHARRQSQVDVYLSDAGRVTA